jgi:hypothetical protein
MVGRTYGERSHRLAAIGSVLAVVAIVSCSAVTAGASGEKTAVAAGSTSSTSTLHGSRPIYWGAWIGKQLTGGQAPWDMSAVSAFETLTGKGVSLIEFSAPWQNCYAACSYYRFDTTAFNNIRAHGAIPFFSWSSMSIPWSVPEPAFQLADIIAGNYDAYIRTWATAAKTWGHPFFLRLDWEMNGNWFPWSEGVNGNRAGEYVRAWRHVHDIFTSVGARNATWVWCPNVDMYGQFTPLAGLYPGSSYVDWTCLDGYDWGTNPVYPKGWYSFDQLYSTTYHEVVDSIAPTKPMMIGEIAASESGGSKSAWTADMLNLQLPQRYPRIKGFLWMEQYADGMDWPIETSPAAQTAFATGVQSSYYAANTFGSVTASPISPP